MLALLPEGCVGSEQEAGAASCPAVCHSAGAVPQLVPLSLFAFVPSCGGFPEEPRPPKVAGCDKRSRANIFPGCRGWRPW